MLDLVRADLHRFRDWGFELVKHDFSTYDVFGRFGPAMGALNSLAFRLPQHNRFFTVDADCVPSTTQTPWELNRQFLDLVARSGTALFVSIDPVSRTEQRDGELSDGMRLALSAGDTGGGIEPLDWLANSTPNSWRAGGGTVRYSWSQAWGSDPAAAY
ncbi:MAG TPA: hypothetical protein VGD71_00510 [Kribbella sp.]